MTTSKTTHYRRLAARAGLCCSACTAVLLPAVLAIELLGRIRFPLWTGSALEILGLGAFVSGVVCIAASLLGASNSETALAKPGSPADRGRPASSVGGSAAAEEPSVRLGSHQTTKVLLLAFFAGIFIFHFAGCEHKSSRGYHLHLLFHNIHQLKIGDPVRMAGIQIGRVESIALDPTNSKSHVTVEVKRSAVVNTDTVAAIRSGASPGDSFIALDNGSPSGVAASEGAYLVTIETPAAPEAVLAIDLGCENLLKAHVGPPPDALSWAKRNPKTFRGGATLEALLTGLTDAGAQGIIVFTNLPSHDYLIILTLPSEAGRRQKVFTCDARFREVCGLEPMKDYGQKYLAYPFLSKP